MLEAGKTPDLRKQLAARTDLTVVEILELGFLTWRGSEKLKGWALGYITKQGSI